jgi:hypothetical protein
MKQRTNAAIKYEAWPQSDAATMTLIAPVQTISEREINFLDIKHLNDIAEENKQAIKDLLLRYKTARLVFKKSENVVHRLYASYEMAFARRQVSELWCIYQSARTGSNQLAVEYIKRLNIKQTYYSQCTVLNVPGKPKKEPEAKIKSKIMAYEEAVKAGPYS